MGTIDKKDRKIKELEAEINRLQKGLRSENKVAPPPTGKLGITMNVSPTAAVKMAAILHTFLKDLPVQVDLTEAEREELNILVRNMAEGILKSV